MPDPNDTTDEPRTVQEKTAALRDRIAAAPGDGWHTAFLALCEIVIAGDDAPADDDDDGDDDDDDGDELAEGAGSGDELAGDDQKATPLAVGPSRSATPAPRAAKRSGRATSKR